MNDSVITEISNKLGRTHAKNYEGSASMFFAKIETRHQQGYFVESSRFEGLDKVLQPKEYKLKVIGEHTVSKVKRFTCYADYRKFWVNLEFTKTNALIVERGLTNYNNFVYFCDVKSLFRDYDNGAYCLL